MGLNAWGGTGIGYGRHGREGVGLGCTVWRGGLKTVTTDLQATPDIKPRIPV